MKTKVKKFKGQLLKELIQKKGISQEEFADDFKVSTQTISYWVRGVKKPSSFNLEMLAYYFDVPQECLTGEFPFLCSKKEYQEITEKIKSCLPTTFQTLTDETIKAFFEYLQLIGKRYDTFDFDTLDKGVIGNTPIFYLIKGIVDKRIEECFVEFGIISEKEVNENGNI